MRYPEPPAPPNTPCRFCDKNHPMSTCAGAEQHKAEKRMASAIAKGPLSPNERITIGEEIPWRNQCDYDEFLIRYEITVQHLAGTRS